MTDQHAALGAGPGSLGGAVPSLRVVQIVVAAELLFVTAAAAAALLFVGTSGPIAGRTPGAGPAGGAGPGGGTGGAGGAGGAGGGGSLELLVWLSLGLAVAAAAVWFVLPRLMNGQVRQQLRALTAQGEAPTARSAGDVLMRGYVTQTILRGAIAQGPALLGSVGLLVTGNHLGLVATGVAMVLLVAAFPSEARARAVAERVAAGA